MIKFEDLINWGFIAMIVAVVALILGEFLNIATSGSAAYDVINNTLALFTEFTAKLPTVGKIAGVVLLIGVIGFAGVYGYNKVKGSRF